MGRKKAVLKDLNEKENNNSRLEHSNNCPPTVSQKRPIGLVVANPIDGEEIEIINLKKRCRDLEQQVEILEKKCLLIPQHIISIQNFFDDLIQCSNNNNDFVMLNYNDLALMNNDDNVTVNGNDVVVTSNYNDDIVTTNNNDPIVTINYDVDVVTINNVDNETTNYITVLNIDDVTLGSLKKENAKSTGRSILKYLYPNPGTNCKLSNIDKSLVDAIVYCAQNAHPSELTTKMKIKHAMSNYF
ncbi:unnamed protein product, partial [Rotaria magnacalcarata]